MSKLASKRRLIIFIATIIFVFSGTILVIRWAKGYRPTRQGTIKGTGLLAANSFPEGAEVYIDGLLTTATDNTLNLNPNTYLIEIKKDGFHTWSKSIIIAEELVTQTNATLFPTAPSFTPITFTGAINPTPGPDGNKIAFTVASASASTKNGLYVQELSSSPISLNRSPKQIARNSSSQNFTQATLTWSPDSSQILASFPEGSHLLLDATKFNDAADFIDVTVTLSLIFKEWEEELAREERAKLLELPDFMMQVATQSATNLYASPDGEKILYQATKELTIPDNLIPPLPSTNTQPETRALSPGSYYVYDLQEDKNFLILESPNPKNIEKIILIDNILALFPPELTSSPSAFKKLQKGFTIQESIQLFNAQYSSIYVTNVQWFPDSYHILLTTDLSINIMEYDSTNNVTLYSGPFDKSFVYPWPNGSSIITLIQFSPETPSNLYAIKLK